MTIRAREKDQMGLLDGLKIFSGLQSLVGMGVATIRMIAAVLTVLGVWVTTVDSISYQKLSLCELVNKFAFRFTWTL
mgnify:CR=1 FL=1